MLLCVHSSFSIILNRKRKLVALLLLSYRWLVTVNVLWLFLTVPWVGLQCVNVVFPDHTHLLFGSFLIFRGLRTRIAKTPYSSKVFQDGGGEQYGLPVPSSGCTCEVMTVSYSSCTHLDQRTLLFLIVPFRCICHQKSMIRCN